ncbi:MAG TPA: MlaD family protein [Actinomycetota bacterium]|nr:MlaD family protein [Actinomycetota bacterium]
MIGWRIKVNLVAFLVISLGLVYAMATQVLSILQPRYSVDAIFPDAGGVFTNQEVTYRGITVGQVGEMRVVEEGVSIELLIDKKYDQIPKEDVEARVMFKSAVGEQFVDLLPATDGEPYLADGDEIPMDQNTIPVSTQELLTTLEAVLRGVPPDALKGAVDSLGIGLTGHGPDLATIIESMADLADLFAERAPEVQGLLRNGSRVGEAFVDSGDDFRLAVENLVEVSEELSQDRPDLQRLLENANLMSEEVVALLRDYEANIDRFLPDFAAVNDLQAEHADDLRELFIHLPKGLGRIVDSFEPTTGLIRFGLVSDNEHPACDYGTERRPPHQREFRPPPKNAGCGSTARGARSTGSASSPGSPASTTGEVLQNAFIQDDSGPSLPSRMDDWSWSLLYLNSV